MPCPCVSDNSQAQPALTITNLLDQPAVEAPAPQAPPPSGGEATTPLSLSGSRAIKKAPREPLRTDEKGRQKGYLGHIKFELRRLAADKEMPERLRTNTLERLDRFIQGLLMRQEFEQRIAEGLDIG